MKISCKMKCFLFIYFLSPLEEGLKFFKLFYSGTYFWKGNSQLLYKSVLHIKIHTQHNIISNMFLKDYTLEAKIAPKN